ncbi:MAG TPA: hypothetical protein VHU91_01215 [Mycobacteriales bacterium]|jgi:hypothetical protein|nr:hypothetical protein [Mycobacteriales bacterium]
MDYDEDTALTGPETIEARWAYDGPRNREQVTEAAEALYSLVRYLNNATGPGAGSRTLRSAATSYRVVSGMKSGVSAMDQLLGQVAGALAGQADNPSLYDDRRDRSPAIPPARPSTRWPRPGPRSGSS